MTIIISCVGVLFILSSVFSFIFKRSLLIGYHNKKYTEKSIRLFIQLASIIRFLLGLSLIIYSISTLTPYSVFINWFCGAFICFAIAAYITLHFVILVKKE